MIAVVVLTEPLDRAMLVTTAQNVKYHSFRSFIQSSRFQARLAWRPLGLA